MALTMPSPTQPGIPSNFSPYSDSPHTPARFEPYSPNGNPQSNRESLAPPPSPYPQQIEPSPVDSNGTENTDIEEEEQEGVKSSRRHSRGRSGELLSPDIEITSPENPPKLDTQLPPRHSDSPNNEPQSVIHIPSGFREFDEGRMSRSSQASPATETSINTARLQSPPTPEASTLSPADRKPSPVSPVNTDVPRVMDRSTPRAQTRQELDQQHKENKRKSRNSSLENIPEAQDKDHESEHVSGSSSRSETAAPDTAGLVGNETMSRAMETLAQAEDEVAALQTALSECWTLCNTLAGLSSGHRQRTFRFSNQSEVQQQAWRSCWRLCQELYDHKDEDHTTHVTPTLELCRDFCQSLFDVRQKTDEASDSVLRVSFELNNHLYNTHDRSLPDAFNERTLDFYITLCHRLMKLRTSLPQETDSLLRACWALAEQLFNLRQNGREGRPVDEELLGSAVQACWELCDLFREGWTQIRPDRNTPRPSQTTFGSQTSFKSASSSRPKNLSSTALSNRNFDDEVGGVPPETPVTVFDDTSTANSSPDSAHVPNILVLGPASNASGSLRGGVNKAAHHDRWTSTASVLSDYSESASSQRTSSTATASSEETQLTRLRYLLLKAGMNTGYSRSSAQSLPSHVQTLSDNVFGTLPWQRSVLALYKKLVLTDKSMLVVHQVPQKRLSAHEVAKSVRWLGNSEQWAWMRDLFRLVFGFGVDEAERRGGGIMV